VYLDGVIPAALARGEADYSADSAWWIFWSLQQLAARNYAHYTPLMRDEWAVFEERIELARRSVEREARAEAVVGHGETAAELLTAFMERSAYEAMEFAEGMRARFSA
jgi:dipeptidase